MIILFMNLNSRLLITRYQHNVETSNSYTSYNDLLFQNELENLSGRVKELVEENKQ